MSCVPLSVILATGNGLTVKAAVDENTSGVLLPDTLHRYSPAPKFPVVLILSVDVVTPVYPPPLEMLENIDPLNFCH